MSTETITGKFDQVKGHVKEAWGDAKDAAHAVSSDARREAAIEHEDAKIHGEHTAHSIRESVVDAAASVKDAVVQHADHVKANH